MSKESGLAVLKKYGKEYFKQLRRRVKKESLAKAGKIGGMRFIEKYGRSKLREIGRTGGEKIKERMKNDEKLRKTFRELFIERMKKFTKVYPLSNGMKVRSKLEKEIGEYLLANGVELVYEPFKLTTKYGEYEPDFLVNNNTIVEVLGMDTDFYLNKKLPKLQEAIKNNLNFKWIIYTPLSSLPTKLEGCFITSKKEELLNLIKTP
jgi:predicted nuclease of restriction endonuclease-like RecB superfamily